LSDAVAQYGANQCAVMIISFTEAVTMVTQAMDYPTIYSLPWFGSDGTSLTQQLVDDAPEQLTHLGLYSTLCAPAETEKFRNLYDRYYEITGQPLGFYTACTYDIAWAIAKAVLEAQSTDPSDIIPILPKICDDMLGATGWTRLNEAGDRYASNYQIWSYNPQPYVAGLYDMLTGEVIWYIDWPWG